jgi:hypothetical protein
MPTKIIERSDFDFKKLEKLPSELKESLIEYISDPEIKERLKKKLEINAVTLESGNARITLYNSFDLAALEHYLTYPA